jgi:acyl carrier protein
MLDVSRFPQGLPNRCPVCGAAAAPDPSQSAGCSPCPNCGRVLWWLRDHFGRVFGVDPQQLHLDTPLRQWGADSLDIVEIVLEAEEEFDVEVPEDEVAKIETIGDLIRLIAQIRRDRAA